MLRRRCDRLSTTARARLQAGLVAGDPTGEFALAWTVAQDLMAPHQLTDAAQVRTRAETLMADLRACPINELARPGRTLHTWRIQRTPIALSGRLLLPDLPHGRLVTLLVLVTAFR
jgi:hypothetical protein